MKEILERLKEMLENFEETEHLLKLGKAVRLACKDGSRFTVLNNGEKSLLEFYEREKED